MENSYEQEIDLKELLFYLLHKWRPIVLIALALAVLLGGYKLGKGILEQNNETQIAKVQKEYDTNIKEYEQKKAGYERSIDNLTANIEFEENYQQNSVSQKIDPYNKWVATADVFVKMEDQVKENTPLIVDPADSIIKAYASAADKGNDILELSHKEGIELNYLKELIDVTTDYESNMLSISTSAEGKDRALEILDTIIKDLKDTHSDIQDHLGRYSLVIMNQSISKVADSELAESQKNRTTNLTNMQTSLSEAQLNLENLKEPPKPADLSKKGILKSGMKYGVLGGILGVFMTGFFYCVIFVMSNKVNSSEELKNRFGIKILGAFTKEREKKAFSGVDSWLDRLEGKEYSREDTVYQRIIANIGNYADKDQAVLLTGTVEGDAFSDLEAKLKEQLPELHFEVAQDMNKYPETLTRIPKADGIILIEKLGVSRYKDIQKELETIYSLDKKIIGCIVL